MDENIRQLSYVKILFLPARPAGLPCYAAINYAAINCAAINYAAINYAAINYAGINYAAINYVLC